VEEEEEEVFTAKAWEELLMIGDWLLGEEEARDGRSWIVDCG
jgi:hypothetical protein